MESELWKRIVHAVEAVSKGVPFVRVQFSDRAIVLAFLWAVLHDRPVSWACGPQNWPVAEAWQRRPSPSTLSRRLRRPAVQTLLAHVRQALSPDDGPTWCKWIDSRPLPVGGSSEDPDVRAGRAAGFLAKGYKLHTISDGGGRVVAWDVCPMNENDKTAATSLLEALDDEGYVVGDNQYDSNRLFDLAATHGHQLVTPRRQGTVFGHQRHSPWRYRSAELLERPFGVALVRQRYDIDRMFGQMGNFGGGLGPLPNWVRRLPRVRRWVHGKLIILAAWRLTKQRLIA